MNVFSHGTLGLSGQKCYTISVSDVYEIAYSMYYTLFWHNATTNTSISAETGNGNGTGSDTGIDTPIGAHLLDAIYLILCLIAPMTV